MQKQLLILGTRGIPASHGGFETFAQHLALYLVKRGWRVTVYCQREGSGSLYEDTWQGVKRIIIPVSSAGARGTVLFDLKATWHAMRHPGLVLVLGYNTAIFNILLRICGKRIVMNMDGIEWQRDKWSWLERAWLRLNEFLGSHLSNHLVADHPSIEDHLSQTVSREKITMIPYGADRLETAHEDVLRDYGIKANEYTLLIARPEPENSILEIVRAFSSTPRNQPLVILGNYDPEHNEYHRQVLDAASDEVKFLGAIYDPEIVQALRYYSQLYVHGHTVGGTNPSLVESLGAGNAILAHDNLFNRWVAGDNAAYFSDTTSCAQAFDRLLGNVPKIECMANASRERHESTFPWSKILGQYEALLLHEYS